MLPTLMRKTLFLIVVGLAASTPSAVADERFFSYSYEADVLPKGKWEFEQWLTYRQGYPDGDRQFSSHFWDFREEIDRASPNV